MKKLLLLSVFSTSLFCGGYTELMTASIRGDLPAVKKLIAKGVDINEKYDPEQDPKNPKPAPGKPDDDNRNSTALMFAIKNSNVEVAKYLIDHMKDKKYIDLTNRNGATALMQSIFYGHEDLAKMLVENGASVNSVSKNGISVLIIAIDKNMSDGFLDYLVRNGADVNYRTAQGWTPLHYAVYKKLPTTVIKSLMDAGGDVDARTEKGWTPLTLAVKNRLPISSIELIANKADLYSKTEQGQSAIKLARENNYEEIIPVLAKILKDKSKIE